MIFDLLTPVAQNATNQLADVKQRIAKLALAEGVQRRVRQTDRVELGRRRGEEIHARALAQLTGHVEEAVAVARRWVSLVETRPSNPDTLSQALADLQSDFIPLKDEIRNDFRDVLDRDNWGWISAGRAMVIRAIEGLSNLFDPETPAKPLELNRPGFSGELRV